MFSRNTWWVGNWLMWPPNCFLESFAEPSLDFNLKTFLKTEKYLDEALMDFFPSILIWRHPLKSVFEETFVPPAVCFLRSLQPSAFKPKYIFNTRYEQWKLSHLVIKNWWRNYTCNSKFIWHTYFFCKSTPILMFHMYL